MTALTRSPAWLALQAHQPALAARHLRELFAADPQRAERFSLEACALLLDYSKQRIDARALELLLALALQQRLPQRIEAMFNGERINATEGRAVLHTALRAPGGDPLWVDGADVMRAVEEVRERMLGFCERVRAGAWLGYSGQPITDVVNIGIGGSDLGPLMVCEALRPWGHPRLRMHFVSNVDGSQLADTLTRLHPATTLFVIASKTFTTQETLTNARSARAWFLAASGQTGEGRRGIAQHFVAVSTNAAAVAEFGIDPQNMFGFWDWVGGRYSLWSAVGLPIALYLGRRHFLDLLAGAHAMDLHFRHAPLALNMPVLLALLAVWNGNFLGATSQLIAPYNQHLHRLPAYLQQLEMESCGKSVRQDGGAVDYATGAVIWGEPGINGQHAYFQLLHQGTGLIPVDFIVALTPRQSLDAHQPVMLANFLAQAEALMLGRSAEEVRAEMQAAGADEAELARLLPHRVFAGNRPSSTLLLPALDPASLGALIALYEHKVFTLGVLWDINAFDQWGVELGKQLARRIHAELLASGPVLGHDASTRRLIEHIKRHIGAPGPAQESL